jgi:hypothetical protein
MAYKSVRLLVEAIHTEMGVLKKYLSTIEPMTPANDEAQDSWIELRKLFDEMAAFADRPTLEDVVKLSPTDYVATMKPLVGNYHRQLMTADQLTACLCEDLQATGTLLVLIGDGKIVIRSAHDPDRPDVAIAIEAMIETLDHGLKQVVEEGVTEAEKKLGLADQPIDQPDDRPLRVKYADRIIQDDFERNARAELVIDCDDIVVKDRNGEVGRKATQEEIDSCITVKDPGSGVGYEDEL